jgi:hypothetical protein
MLGKFYSLDECSNKDNVFEYLEELSADSKISFQTVDYDVIKIKDLSLSVKDQKELLNFFDKNDVIEYADYESYSSEEDIDEDDEYGDFDDYDEDEDY